MAKKSDNNTPSYKLIDDQPGYKLIDNPIDRRYRDRFNDFRSSNNNLGSVESGSSGQTMPNIESRRMGVKNRRSSSDEAGTTAEDNTNLANQENAQPEGFNYNPSGSKKGDGGSTYDSSNTGSSGSIKRVRARIANKIRRTGGKKTAAYAAGALGGGVGIALLVFIVMMYLLGFGGKQTAIVIRNFEFGRIYTMAAKTAQRLVKAKAEAKIGRENPDSIKDPKGLAKGIKELDLDKVAKNLGTKPFEFEERSSRLIIKNGSKEVDMSKSGAGEKLESKIIRGNADPLKSDAAVFENPTANSTFEKSGVKKFAWSKETLDKTAKETTEKARATEEKATYDRVRGSPKIIDAKEPTTKAAQDELMDRSDGVAKAITETKDAAAIGAKGRSIAAVKEASQKIVSKFAKSFTSWSTVMTLVMTVCTVQQITESYVNEAKNATEQSQRQAAKLQSFNDQYQNVTNGQVVGANVAMLGNINQSAAYQQSIGNPNANSGAYNGLDNLDTPVPEANTVLKMMIVSMSVLDKLPAAPPLPKPSQGDLYRALCPKLADPRVALGTAAVAILAEAAATVLTGGLAEAGGQSIKQILMQAMKKIFAKGGEKDLAEMVGATASKKLASEVTEKTIKDTLSRFSPTKIIDKALLRFIANPNHTVVSRYFVAMLRAGINMGPDAAKWFAIGYFANEMAGMNTGNVYNGTDDGLFIDKAAAGTEVMQSNQQRTQMYAMPLKESQVAELDRVQQNQFLEDQKGMGLYTRFASLSNPYSLLSRVLVGPAQFVASIHGKPIMNSIGVVKSNILQGFASIFNPSFSNNGVGRLVAATITPRQATYAATANMEINHFNVPQFGYTTAEQDKMTNDPRYSTFNIAKWAEAHKDKIQEWDEKYGACFDPSTNFIDAYGIMKALDIKISWLKSDGACQKGEAFFPTDDGFRWRLYHADLNEMANLKNLEEVTENSSNSSAAGTSVDMDNMYDDSSSVACAPGTNDLGVQDGYRAGNLIKIRVCAVPGFKSSGEESQSLAGANGNVIINSRVSGAVHSMLQAAKADNVTLVATSSFRTMEHQQRLWNANPDPNSVARPGTSNHQMGLAIDFDVGGKCPAVISGQCSSPGNPIWDWLNSNAAKFGYKSSVKTEAWHWSPSGN